MQLPPFYKLVENYDTDPDPKAVKRRIGGELTETWLGENTCVMRMSKAFNYAGTRYRIRKGMGMAVVKGEDGLWYGYRVQEFKTYLRNMYGGAKAIKEKGKLINEKDFKDITGIIGLDVSNWSDASGHFSLWDGKKILYESDHHYLNMPRVLKDKTTPTLTQLELWKC